MSIVKQDYGEVGGRQSKYLLLTSPPSDLFINLGFKPKQFIVAANVSSSGQTFVDEHIYDADTSETTALRRWTWSGTIQGLNYTIETGAVISAITDLGIQLGGYANGFSQLEIFAIG